MKLAIVLTVIVALSGCGIGSRIAATFKGADKICVDGVTYLQFASGATVQVDLDGKPVRCL